MSTNAGWFPAADRPGHLRYWDGVAWTDQYAQMHVPPPASDVPAGSNRTDPAPEQFAHGQLNAPPDSSRSRLGRPEKIAVIAVGLVLAAAVVFGVVAVLVNADGNENPSVDSEEKLPAVLDATLGASEMAGALEAAFCDGVMDIYEGADGSTGTCRSPNQSTLVWRIFDSETQLRLYLDNSPCDPGALIYLEQGPTWEATALTTTDAAMLEDAGASPLTCNAD